MKISKDRMPKKGDKVKIVRRDIGSYLSSKPKPLLGTVTNVNGFYVMVRPKYQRFEIELYPNEIVIL